MPNNSKLLKFRNLNIKTYLNDILPQFEKSILISDLNFIERIRKEVDTEIFKSFLLNSDSLLEVLYTYESVKSNLNYLEDFKNDYNHNIYNFNDNDNNLNIDLNKLEEFRNVLKNFTSEVDSYDTGSRILIHFDIFLDENDNRNIFLLTNDILIIGKIDSRIRKYQLVNAYSYLIVDIKIESEKGDGNEGGSRDNGDSSSEGGSRGGSSRVDNWEGVDNGDNEGGVGRDNGDSNPSSHPPSTPHPISTTHPSTPHTNNSYLYVVLSKSFTKFKGNKKNIDKFYSIFKDLNYNFEDLNEKDNQNQNKNELIEFLIETEQYEEIEKYKKDYKNSDYNDVNMDNDFNDYNQIYITNINILFLFKNLSFNFLLKRFKSILENINKVMPFKDLIDLLFNEIFMKFRKEQEEILKDLNLKINYLLLLEKEILMIFKLIESRIFNNNNNLLKDKLLFDQYDFTYLTDYFTKKRKYHQEECFKEAKKEIDVLLREMVNE